MKKAERLGLIVALILVALYFLVSYLIPPPVTSLPEIPVIQNSVVYPSKLNREIVLVPSIVTRSSGSSSRRSTAGESIPDSVVKVSPDTIPSASDSGYYSPEFMLRPQGVWVMVDTSTLPKDTIKHYGSLVTPEFKMDYEIATQGEAVLYLKPRFTALKNMRPKHFHVAGLAGAAVFSGESRFAVGAYGAYRGYSLAYLTHGKGNQSVLLGVNFKF